MTPNPTRSGRARVTVWRAAWLAAAALTLTACGYRYADIYPAEFRTVAVPVFENRTFDRDVAYEVTEALIKHLESRTPYKTAGTDRADTLLRGTVTGVDRRPLSRTAAGGLPQEIELVVTVDFAWIDQRRGEVLVAREGFTSVGRYVPTLPVGEDDARGRQAAAARLAADVVAQLRSGW